MIICRSDVRIDLCHVGSHFVSGDLKRLFLCTGSLVEITSLAVH